MPVFLLAGAIGAAVAYFLDPDNGRRRRKQAVDRTAAFVRQRSREATRAGPGVPPYARDVNTVFQDYALSPHMTVAENVGYGLRVKGIRRRERERRVQEV